MTTKQVAFALWLMDRPTAIQEIAAKYPPGTKFMIHGNKMHVVSYEEYGDGKAGVSVSTIDPAEDYAAAISSRQYVCMCCMPKLDALLIP